MAAAAVAFLTVAAIGAATIGPRPPTIEAVEFIVADTYTPPAQPSTFLTEQLCGEAAHTLGHQLGVTAICLPGPDGRWILEL